MKKTSIVLMGVILGNLLFFSFNRESKKVFLSPATFKSYKRPRRGVFHLNILCKNDAGVLHLNALNIKDNSNPGVNQLDLTGYGKVQNPPGSQLTLPNDDINEITPTMDLFRDNNGHGKPARGPWLIKFNISCLSDEDLVERVITPDYCIQGRNYFDYLQKDDHGNDGFKIYLIQNFTLKDTLAMKNRNLKEYNDFLQRTDRSLIECK